MSRFVRSRVAKAGEFDDEGRRRPEPDRRRAHRGQEQARRAPQNADQAGRRRVVVAVAGAVVAAVRTDGTGVASKRKSSPWSLVRAMILEPRSASRQSFSVEPLLRHFALLESRDVCRKYSLQKFSWAIVWYLSHVMPVGSTPY